MRFNKSMLNLISSWFGQIFLMFVTLFSRRVFLETLGEEYLGISGLFSNVLSILSLAELGIGSAINYSLYKPLAQNDIATIKSLMGFYKKVYKVIGTAVIGLGIGIIPLLGHIVSEISEYEYIYIYYILFVLNTAVSYFYSYKSTLIIANQEKIIYSVNHYFWLVILNIIQIIVLRVFRNYMIYLVLQVIFTLVENFSIAKIADIRFPYLRDDNIQPINKITLAKIKKDTVAATLDKIGSVMVTATDNIIMSSYISIAVTGLYSSYAYVISSVGSIFRQIFLALQASVGDYGVTVETGKRESIFDIVSYVGFIFCSFATVCLLYLLTPFVRIWLGERYILDTRSVVLIVIVFYLSGIRQSQLVFIQALGLFWQHRYKAVIEGMINLIISIIGVNVMGFNGIFLGTLVSSFVAGFIIEPYVLYKYGLEDKTYKFVIKQIKYSSTLLIIVGVISCANKVLQLKIASLGEMFIEFFVCAIICFIVNIFIWRNTVEYKSCKGYVVRWVVSKKYSKKLK
ncbi:MAG: hypothetical protein NC313_13450 [Butyrivibrio sp.]|nr:hypothetical protein [Butyrivibrio sp.]